MAPELVWMMRKKESLLDLQGVEPRLLACLGTTLIELFRLADSDREWKEHRFASCRIFLYFRAWKMCSVFVVTDFVCSQNLASEQKATKHCFVFGAHCCVTVTEGNRRVCIQPEKLWRKKKRRIVVRGSFGVLSKGVFGSGLRLRLTWLH
jgi:hypothetical protein